MTKDDEEKHFHVCHDHHTEEDLCSTNRETMQRTMGSMANAIPMPEFVLIDKDQPDLVKKLMVKAAIVKASEISKFE